MESEEYTSLFWQNEDITNLGIFTLILLCISIIKELGRTIEKQHGKH